MGRIKLHVCVLKGLSLEKCTSRYLADVLYLYSYIICGLYSKLLYSLCLIFDVLIVLSKYLLYCL